MAEDLDRYAASHRDRVNLLVHLLAVPLFSVATIVMLLALVEGQLRLGATGFALLAVSLGLQGIGHKREGMLPTPFQGPFDFLTRIAKEQFWRFPRFVLSGRWWANFRAAGSPTGTRCD